LRAKDGEGAASQSGGCIIDPPQSLCKRDFPRDAAFDLHQAVERLYHCVLLVSTFYTPHVHNIAFRRAHADKLDPRPVDVWPRGKREE
jgi:hypothetical protein